MDSTIFSRYAASSITSQPQPATALVTTNQQAFRDNANVDNCVLFIFSPQDFADNYVRPTRYNFDRNFVDTACNVLKRSQNNAAQLVTAASVDSTLATSILPDSNVAYRVNTHKYSDRSTYMIVINSSSTRSTSGVVTGPSTREIITGWIASGDTNVISQSGAIDINMILNPTHYTKYSLIPAGGYGASNYGGVRAVCDVDVDLVHDDQIGAIEQSSTNGNRNWYNLSMVNGVRQAGIINGLSCINFGDGVSLFDNTCSGIEPICSSSSAEVMSTRDKDSSIQVADLMINMNNLITEQVSNGRRSNTINTDSAQLAQLGASAYCAIPVGTAFDPTQPITFRTLQVKFGSALSVVNCDIPYDCTFDRTDKGGRTSHNIACTMITNAMPNILSTYSLSQVSFSYDSTLTNQHTLQRGMFYWHTFVPITPLADNMYANQISLLESSLRSTILSKVATVFGHFRCNVLASVYTNTVINIYLYDHDFGATDAYFDTNNILGGLNTPLIGSISDLNNNARNISTITQGVINPTVETMSGLADNYYQYY